MAKSLDWRVLVEAAVQEFRLHATLKGEIVLLTWSWGSFSSNSRRREGGMLS